MPGVGAGRVEPPGNCGREIPPSDGPPVPGVGRVAGRSVPVKFPSPPFPSPPLPSPPFPSPPGAGRVDGCKVLGNLMLGRLDGFKPLNPPGAGRVALPAPMFPVFGKLGF